MGHGHVTPNEDGSVARCGGPALCDACALELAELNRARTDTFLAGVRDKLERYGVVVQAVVPHDDREAVFAYTVGLEPGHPELMLCGLDHETAHAVLDALGKDLKDGKRRPVRHGVAVIDALAEGYALMPLDLGTDAQVNVASAILGAPARAFQLVWPDAEHRWPWESGYGLPPGAQPVYGIPPEAVTQ